MKRRTTHEVVARSDGSPWKAAGSLLLVAVLGALSGCSSSSSPTSPTAQSTVRVVYEGTLTLTVSNGFPEFTAKSTPVSVAVKSDGRVECGTGYLNYNAEETNGQSKIHRSGSMTISPVQLAPFDEGMDFIQLTENTQASEHLRLWVMQNGEWRLKLDEYPSATWNGGLAFSARKALNGGDSLSSDGSGQGTTRMGAVTWTLVLHPVS